MYTYNKNLLPIDQCFYARTYNFNMVNLSDNITYVASNYEILYF